VTKFFSRLLDSVACADVVTKQVRAVLADPLTQLALVFATLAMDVGHEGVSNDQIEKETPELGKAYNHRAIAEQHSIALMWELLMAPCFSNLQQALFPTREEFLFFRRVMVNAVMATDFTDAKLAMVRTERWRQIFSPAAGNSDLVTHERATLIMECMAQTASVAYCLQHWPVYKKWSTLLFEEQYHAFLTYRSDRNPAETWFNDQIVLFDAVIVPLAKRMAHCGIFDATAGEYLQCAQRNRDELFRIGHQLVAEMVESVHEELFQRQEI
jgi:3'5'-cyclic nucleotide phosphodiesterase